MAQNRHPFVDVQTPRGDGQPLATFKCCAEIFSHTEEMCSTTAPQGMQGKTFAAKTEKYFRKLHGDMHTKCSEELHSRQKIPKQIGERTVCNCDLLSGSFS